MVDCEIPAFAGMTCKVVAFVFDCFNETQGLVALHNACYEDPAATEIVNIRKVERAIYKNALRKAH